MNICYQYHLCSSISYRYWMCGMQFEKACRWTFHFFWLLIKLSVTIFSSMYINSWVLSLSLKIWVSILCHWNVYIVEDIYVYQTVLLLLITSIVQIFASSIIPCFGPLVYVCQYACQLVHHVASISLCVTFS